MRAVDQPTYTTTMVVPFATLQRQGLDKSALPTPGYLCRRGCWSMTAVLFKGFIQFYNLATKNIFTVNSNFILVL